MRPIRKDEIRFVGDKVQFRGAAQRLLERMARLRSRREGHTVSADQVAEGLVAGVQKGIGMHADLIHAMDNLQQVLQKIRER